MAIAFDASSVRAAAWTTANFNWSHTPVGTPRGVVVFVVEALQSADGITGVTYGGEAMTEVTGSPHIRTSPSTGAVHCYVLTSSVPTGEQTVEVSITGDKNRAAICVTLTAAADSEVVDTDATIDSGSLSNPSCVLSLSSKTCWGMIGFMSGHGDPSDIAPNSGWTSITEQDQGAVVSGYYRYDTIGSTDITAGWTQTAEDAVAIAIAIAEVAGGQKAVGITDITITFST